MLGHGFAPCAAAVGLVGGQAGDGPIEVVGGPLVRWAMPVELEEPGEVGGRLADDAGQRVLQVVRDLSHHVPTDHWDHAVGVLEVVEAWVDS